MIKIVVHFSRREDGGLRAWSDDVPGFVLSHRDAQAVMDDVEPALETILSSMHNRPVIVAPLVPPSDYDVEPPFNFAAPSPPPAREYASQLAA
jgi:hypothetical protein